MNAVQHWCVVEQRGDRMLIVFLALVSLTVALPLHFSNSFGSATARDLQGGIGMFAALFLAFRYAFAGGRAWILAVDAKRALLPSLPERIFGVEALRVAVFAMLPALPFALVGALPAAESIFAAALTGVSVGMLFSLTPYRFNFAPAGGVLALIVGNQSGFLAWSSGGALVAAAVFFACSGVFVRWRIAAIAAAQADARVGGAYSVAQAIGRHSGSIWSAPDASPLEAMSKERNVGSTPPTPMALLGEPVAGRLARPGRALRDWILALGLFPVLMSGCLVVLAAIDGATMASLQRIFALVWPGLVLTWVPFGAVVLLWLGTFRQMRTHLRPGHPLHDALHLLPGMPISRRAWQKLLQPIVQPPLLVGIALLLSAVPFLPVGPVLLLPVIAASLTAGLVLVQPAVAMSANDSALVWGYIGAALSALLLVVLYLLFGVNTFPEVIRAL